MQHSETVCNIVDDNAWDGRVPLTIGGETYWSLIEVAADAGVARQTLWRWHTAGVIPRGARYRGRRLLFTADDKRQIAAYAHRLEPLDVPSSRKDALHELP